MTNYRTAATGQPPTGPGYWLANDACELIGRYRTYAAATLDREHRGDHVVYVDDRLNIGPPPFDDIVQIAGLPLAAGDIDYLYQMLVDAKNEATKGGRIYEYHSRNARLRTELEQLAQYTREALEASKTKETSA